MKYDKLSTEELIEKINLFEQELKGYVDRIDQRYNVFFERNLAGLYRSKMGGEIIECNSALAKILGFTSKDDLIGLNSKNLYYNSKERDERIALIKEKKYILNQKLALKKKDGSKIWVSISATKINDAKSNTPYLEGTIIDITELINTQELLQQNELKYKNTLDQSPYGILIHKKGVIIYFNERAEELLNGKLKRGDQLMKEFKSKTLFKSKVELKKGITHYDRVEIADRNKKMFLDVYVKKVLFLNEEMTELSFVDIQDRIKLEEEKIKNEFVIKLNEQLKSEITKKEIVEKELIKSVEANQSQAARLKSIFDIKTHIIFSVDRSLRLTSFNNAFIERFKTKANITPKLRDAPLEEYINMKDDVKKIWATEVKKAFKGEATNFVVVAVFENDIERYTNVYMNPIYEKNEITQISIIAHDVTDRVVAEARLNESLKEKDILLKEVHHRVKNNLQVISSIFNLQSAYSKEPGIKEVLKESQTRIKSMAYIHESLYKSKNFGKINFEEYINKLCKNLIQSYTIKDNKVSLLTETEKVILHLDQAVPCGLIVNEIISNALKHAFKPDDAGIIIVYLKKKEGRVHLKLVDNGIGIPASFLDGENDTLGIQLIRTLTEQLRGEISFITNEGTSIELIFDFMEN